MKRLLCLGLFLSGIIAAFAQGVPALMNYQGRLTDENGAPLPDGIYRLAFRLYTNAVPPANTASDPVIWGRQYDVNLIEGGFNVILGATGAGPVAEAAAVNDLGFAFNSPNRFLELRIVRDGSGAEVNRTILPRQQLLSAPYAVRADTAYAIVDGAVSEGKLAANAVTTAKLANTSVTTAKLANNSVTTAKIDGGAVTLDKLGDNLFQAQTYSWNNTTQIQAFDTGRNSSAWYPVLVGCNLGTGDVQEDSTGALGGVWFTTSSGTWRINCGFRTHNNLPDPTVTVLWVPRRLVSVQ